MGIINKIEDQQSIRIHGVGNFHLIKEDWMIKKVEDSIKNSSEKSKNTRRLN